MARFKGTLYGQNNGYCTRLGDDDSGITLEADAEGLGVRVMGMVYEKPDGYGLVSFEIFATDGRMRRRTKLMTFIGRVTLKDGKPIFEGRNPRDGGLPL